MSSELNKKLHELQKVLPEIFWSENNICFFNDCDNGCIGSHSISESKVLSLLEYKTDRNGIAIYHLEDTPHVDFGTDKALSSFHRVKRQLQIKGKDKTSVFYGFCKDCDSEVFKKIDREDYSNLAEVNFLHSLRTRAYNLTIERNTYLMLKNKVFTNLDMSINEIDKTLNPLLEQLIKLINTFPDNHKVYWNQVEQIVPVLSTLNTLQVKEERELANQFIKENMEILLNPLNYPLESIVFKQKFNEIISLFKTKSPDLSGSDMVLVREAVNDKISIAEDQISALTKKYRTNDFSSQKYLCIPVEGIFLTAGAFVFNSKYGTSISLTYFPEKQTNRTYFLFSEDLDTKTNSTFLSELNLLSIAEFKQTVSSFILSYGSNIFLSPKYYQKLPDQVKELLITDKSELRKTGFNLFNSEFISNLD